jgi:hypothetical protein
MVQAFGSLIPDTMMDASDQHHRRVASGAAAAALSHPSEQPSLVERDPAVSLASVLLPPELAALTGFLCVSPPPLPSSPSTYPKEAPICRQVELGTLVEIAG